MESTWQARKVVIVGAGAVGSSLGYALAQSGVANEIILMDANNDLAEGQVLDLAHGLPYYPPVEIRTGTRADYADASVIVITAGAKQHPGESRLNLLQRNASIVGSIVDEITGQGSSGTIVIATNPVDIITHVALKRSGWPSGRVIGSGTVLDSARFRYLISTHFNVDVGNVHAYILGEHGDSEVPVWSMTHVAGVEINEYAEKYGSGEWPAARERIAREVKESAYHIISYKGSTYYAIGMALVRIVGAILQDQQSVLTVSTLLNGEYGLSEVCLSIPCILGHGGVLKTVEASLTEDEQIALKRSARILKEALDSLSS
jgi:L-lactate dehydrogenase